jgi:hypothetical protein
VAKTGLGSSAALTTSLVSSLLQFFDVTRVGLRADSDDRRVVHNLAQLVHASAQGKIGSGFDVAAAVYGTPLLPDCLSACLYVCLSVFLSTVSRYPHMHGFYVLCWSVNVFVNVCERPLRLILWVYVMLRLCYYYNC